LGISMGPDRTPHMPVSPAPTSTDGTDRDLTSLLRNAAFLAKCLSDENRLRILLCVCRSKKSVSRIVEELNLSQPLVSHHLKELRRSLLVTVERKGPFVYYESADPRIEAVVRDLSFMAEDLLAGHNTF